MFNKRLTWNSHFIQMIIYMPASSKYVFVIIVIFLNNENSNQMYVKRFGCFNSFCPPKKSPLIHKKTDHGCFIECYGSMLTSNYNSDIASFKILKPKTHIQH